MQIQKRGRIGYLKQKLGIIRIIHRDDPDILLPDKVEVLPDPIRKPVYSQPMDPCPAHSFDGRQFTIGGCQDLFRGAETIDKTLK